MDGVTNNGLPQWASVRYTRESWAWPCTPGASALTGGSMDEPGSPCDPQSETLSKKKRKDKTLGESQRGFGSGGKGAKTHPMSSFPRWETEAQGKGS